MKCKNHPGVIAIENCSNCNTPMCGVCSNFTDSGVLCDRCIDVAHIADFVSAQGKQADEVKILTTDRKTTGDKAKKLTRQESIERREKMYMAILVLSFLFISFRVYTSIGATSILTQQQIQAEEVAINQLNLCVMVFWEIAAQLQNNQEPEQSLACAESDELNIISRDNDDIIVTHPHPELLGYSEISVRKSNPVPIFTP